MTKDMSNKSLVKLSNTIGLIAIILLVYWVFTFISISVFGLKVFRENITQTFYLSIMGILALMFGALITNIMFNLTRIAEKHNHDNLHPSRQLSQKTALLFGLSFPLLFGLLLGGDYLTSQKKEKMLISSARSIIEENPAQAKKLVNYTFDEKWIMETVDILDLFSKTDKHFPYVSVIVSDTLDRSQVFLGFRDYHKNRGDSLQPVKKAFIQPTTREEREYLKKVLLESQDEVRFNARNGQYELFYPCSGNGKKVVLYFSEYQQYGKFGS